jgi:hypothetical protein
MMWRLRLLLERIGWKPFAIGAVVVAVLVAAGVGFAVVHGDDEPAAQTQTTAPAERTNLYYLRAVAPDVLVSGCRMNILFTWKPDFHAIQYLGATAIITASGTDIAGSYRRRFTRRGVSVNLGPVSLAGGYKVWSAKVTSLDGDPPGNDTTVQAATPPNSKCD